MVGDTTSEILQPSLLSISVPKGLLPSECIFLEEDLCYTLGHEWEWKDA